MSVPKRARSTAREGAASVVDKAGEELPAEAAAPDPNGDPEYGRAKHQAWIDAAAQPVARRRGFHGVMKWVVWVSVWITVSLAALLFVDAVERMTDGEDEDEE